MKGIKVNVLRVLKKIIDGEVSADKQLSSKCISIFYQPSRKKAKDKKK